MKQICILLGYVFNDHWKTCKLLSIVWVATAVTLYGWNKLVKIDRGLYTVKINWEIYFTE
jgi:hypothetical protein